MNYKNIRCKIVTRRRELHVLRLLKSPFKRLYLTIFPKQSIKMCCSKTHLTLNYWTFNKNYLACNSLSMFVMYYQCKNCTNCNLIVFRYTFYRFYSRFRAYTQSKDKTIKKWILVWYLTQFNSLFCNFPGWQIYHFKLQPPQNS